MSCQINNFYKLVDGTELRKKVNFLLSIVQNKILRLKSRIKIIKYL